MRRLLNAVSEWLQLRARLREERQFHLDCATTDLRNSGLNPREARRAARRCFGRQSLSAAARELGSDLAGLRHLIRVNRVVASAWLQPAALLAAILLIFLFVSDRQAIANGVFIRIHRVDMSRAVLLSVEGRKSWMDGAVTPSEFEALQTMTTLTGVERYHGFLVWGHAVPLASLPAIVSEARNKTGNTHLSAQFMSPGWEVIANPLQSVWIVIAGFGVFLLLRNVLHWRLLLYGIAVGALHATASLAIWALAMGQRQPVALLVIFSGVAAIQCRYWWLDLKTRCPICFERIVLPLTTGAAESMIVRPAVTESICARGHGVLVESRWSRAFLAESPLESLADV